MKKIAMLFLLLTVLLSQGSHALEQTFRSAWVSTVYNLDYPSAPGLSEVQLKAEADSILAAASKAGLTALFLQVRPCGDALYSSKIYPWSVYLSGTQGTPPPNNFDPLSYFITQAKPLGIEIHGWINPYRVTKKASASPTDALSSLSADNPVRNITQALVFHSDGNLYLDPGDPAAQQLILKGIDELCANYPLAGIHMDDYFYPGQDFADSKSFETGKKDGETIGDFRRRNVTQLVYQAYDLVKSKNPKTQFGISPFGVWANNSSSPEGSETHSSQSYYDHYADTKKWVKEGKLDYIMPQLYWATDYPEAPYSVLLPWWEGVVQGTGVKLYTGLAAYRIPDAQKDTTWYGTGEISSQLSQNAAGSQVTGYGIFRMDNITTVAGLSELLSGELGSGTLTLTNPKEAISTTLPRYFLCGTAQGSLTINGKNVTLSESGYFSESLPLSYGENSFVLRCGAQVIEQRIYRKYAYIPSETLVNLDFSSDLAHHKIPRATDTKYGLLKTSFKVGSIKSTLFNSKTINITQNFANVYSTPSSATGATATLSLNSSFTLTETQNGFGLLEGIGWVKSNNFAVAKRPLPSGKITEVVCLQTPQSLVVDFMYSGKLSAGVRQQDSSFIVTISGDKGGKVPEADIIDITRNLLTNGMEYSFDTPSTLTVSGYYMEELDGFFRLTILNKKQLEGEPLLNGVNVLLDPGHGGAALGATTCKPQLFEKEINLDYAKTIGQMLMELGAKVEYTRNADTDISLDQRYAMAAEKKPDIFLSIHSNSSNYDSLVSKLDGVSLYTNGQHNQGFSKAVETAMVAGGIDFKELITDSNLYMAKPKFCNALLLENQFTINPKSLERLLNPDYKTDYCAAVVQGIVNYYRNNSPQD